MTDDERTYDKRRRDCAKTDRGDTDCGSDCVWDRSSRRCTAPDIPDALKKLFDGSKFITFRHNKTPAVTIRIPVNKDTLFGKYAGAIRFDSLTGRLVLCYGIVGSHNPDTGVPVLSTLLGHTHNRNMWRWYQQHGRTLIKKRLRAYTDDDDMPYASIFALPGAYMQLTWEQIMHLQSFKESLTSEYTPETGDFAKTGAELREENAIVFLSKMPSEYPVGGRDVPDDAWWTKGEFAASFDAYKTKAETKGEYDYNPWAVLGEKPSREDRYRYEDSSSDSDSSDSDSDSSDSDDGYSRRRYSKKSRNKIAVKKCNVGNMRAYEAFTSVFDPEGDALSGKLLEKMFRDKYKLCGKKKKALEKEGEEEGGE